MLFESNWHQISLFNLREIERTDSTKKILVENLVIPATFHRQQTLWHDSQLWLHPWSGLVMPSESNSLGQVLSVIAMQQQHLSFHSQKN